MYSWIQWDRRFKLGLIALFLLIVVDGITTGLAAMMHGTQSEANPFIRWALEQGWPTFVGVNALAGVLCLAAVALLTKQLAADSDTFLDVLGAKLYTVWVYGLISFGLFLAVNNIIFILNGYGLVTLLNSF